MKDVFFPVCAIASWFAFLYKIRGLRRYWRHPALPILCVNFALLGITFTVSTPLVSAVVDALLGVPNVAAFCIHVSVVVYSFSVQAMLLFWTYPPARAWSRARWWLVALGVVLGTMVALFALAGIGERHRDFLLDNAGRPIVAGYLLCYVSALTVALIVTARKSWRYARIAGRPWLRRGLRANAAGATLVLGYCATRVADVAGHWLGADPGAWEFLVPLFAGSGALITIVGLLLPAWGPRLSAACRLVHEYRTHRRLCPLWTALYRATPAIALHPPASRLAERFSLRDLDHRLYRRVIEIHDGRLALRPWFDPVVPAAAEHAAREAGLTGAELDATIEACTLDTALRAKAAGRPAREPAPSGVDGRGRGDLPGEIAWLTRVATAFARSPVLADVARRTQPASTSASRGANSAGCVM